MATIPSSFRAGDTVTWTESAGDYPATTHTLKYTLSGPGGQYTLTSTASGTDHLFTLAAATSANYTAGVYEFIAYAVDIAAGTTRYTLHSGRLEVLADLTQQTGVQDNRSTARKVFDNLKTVITNRSTKGYESMTVNGRSITEMSWGELLTAYHHFERIVADEENAARIAGGGSSKKILVRFDNAT